MPIVRRFQVTSEKDLFTFLEVTSHNLSSDYIPKLTGGLALSAYQHHYEHDNEVSSAATATASTTASTASVNPLQPTPATTAQPTLPLSNHSATRSPYHRHSLEDDIGMIHEIAKVCFSGSCSFYCSCSGSG